MRPKTAQELIDMSNFEMVAIAPDGIIGFGCDGWAELEEMPKEERVKLAHIMIERWNSFLKGLNDGMALG